MKLGFIGCGNMASTIIKGILKNEICKKEDIIGSNPTEEECSSSRERLGIRTTQENREVVRNAEVVFLSVKPQFYAEVIREVREEIRPEQVVITIAPGKTIEWVTEQFGKPVKLVRTMPNTPALVGEGMTGMCANERITEEELQMVKKLLESFGEVEIVPERLLDVVVSVSGSSPAYIFLLIEAMADGAVADGMPRKQAYRFASQAVLGSAKMVLETGMHPGELKDMVCSPGGTTMEAVRVLEQHGFRSAVIEAMKACVNMSRNM